MGPQWRFFHKRIRLNTNALIIYASTTEKTRQTNRTLTIYTVSCDYQMFQVNFVPSLVADRKNAVWFFVQNDLSFRVLSRRSMVTMLLAPGYNCGAPEPSTIRMLWETAEETWQRSLALLVLALIVAMKRCGRL